MNFPGLDLNCGFWFGGPARQHCAGWIATDEQKNINTTVYRLPCAGFAEKDGSMTNSARWVTWKYAAVPPPGQARLDQDIIAQIFLRVRDLYRKNGGKFPDPILNLSWAYADAAHPPLSQVASDPLNNLGRIPGILLLHQLEDTARVLEREVISHVGRQSRRRRWTSWLTWHRFGCVTRRRGRARLAADSPASFVIPCGFVVRARCSVKPGVQTILRKFETLFHNERGVRVVDEIFFGDTIVLDGVADQAAEECDVRAGANLQEKVCGCGRARESGVYGNELGVAVALGLHRPLESAGMVLGGISAHDQHHVGVLDVDPAIRHRPASKRWSQT
jgi:hypothetical protein